MGEPLIAIPPSGWGAGGVGETPVSNYRYELTDGVLSAAPLPSNLHQMLTVKLAAALEMITPEPCAVAAAAEIRFSRQLTRIPDVMVVRSDDPGRHWFTPAEVLVAAEVESPGNHVEDRATKPALYAQFGIPHYWRLEFVPLRVTTYHRDRGDAYIVATTSNETLTSSEPFPVDLDLVTLLPRWAC